MAIRREFTFRRLFAGLAAFCAVGAVIAFFGIYSNTAVRPLSGGSLSVRREAVEAVLEQAFGTGAVRLEPGDDPYGGALGPSAADQATLISDEWAGLPLEERQLTVLYYSLGGQMEIAEAQDALSPSGAQAVLRGGLLPGDVFTLPPDQDRRVWHGGYSIGSAAIRTAEQFLLYYDGGSQAVNGLLESYFGEPLADGRLSDPAEPISLSGKLRRFAAWDQAGDFAAGVVVSLLAILFFILALRPPRKDPSAAARQLVARLAQRGVPLSPYGRMAQGPFGRFPHEVSFSAYLPAYSAGDIRKGEREADRQGKTAFPENLLAVSFFPSARKAKQAAELVAPSGDRLKAGNVRLPYAPARRLYRKDGMIVYYAGSDQKLAGALEAICGKPFAGAGVRSRRED